MKEFLRRVRERNGQKPKELSLAERLGDFLREHGRTQHIHGGKCLIWAGKLPKSFLDSLPSHIPHVIDRHLRRNDHIQVVVSEDLEDGNCALWVNDLQITLHSKGVSCTTGLTTDRNLAVFSHMRNSRGIKMLDQSVIHSIASHLSEGICPHH